MISWVTHLLAWGFLALEIYLLAVKRGRSTVTAGQGSVQLIVNLGEAYRRYAKRTRRLIPGIY